MIVFKSKKMNQNDSFRNIPMPLIDEESSKKRKTEMEDGLIKIIKIDN
jgi:hypothetical protein